MAFYERTLPEEMYDAAWTRFMDDQVLHARGAWLDGHLVGITHFLVHPNTSNRDVCYLQDLFTAPEARSRGVARALDRVDIDCVQMNAPMMDSMDRKARDVCS